jgi:hypothetical protein
MQPEVRRAYGLLVKTKAAAKYNTRRRGPAVPGGETFCASARFVINESAIDERNAFPGTDSRPLTSTDARSSIDAVKES